MGSGTRSSSHDGAPHCQDPTDSEAQQLSTDAGAAGAGSAPEAPSGTEAPRRPTSTSRSVSIDVPMDEASSDHV